MRTVRTTTQPDTKVRVSRVLRAPIQRVYAAFIEPEQLRQWWGPDDVATHELVLEPKVGGELRWALSDSDDTRLTVRGEVFEHVPREKISFTWQPDDRNWPQPSRVNIDLREGRGVEIRIIHEDLPDQQSRTQHEQAWNSTLDKLERLLSAGR